MQLILDTSQNHQKIIDILEDSAFRKLKKDQTAKTERTVTKLIKATEWMDEIKALLIPRASVAPCIYGLPKYTKKVTLCDLLLIPLALPTMPFHNT